MTTQQSFLEILPPVAFAAGEQRTFAITGSYFEIIDAVDPVDIVLSDVYGARRGLMKGAEASFHLKNTEFAVVQITSATAQTIRFAYGSGEAGTRRAAGAVTIVGTVPVSGPLTDAQLRASRVGVRLAEQATNHFQSVAALLSNTPETVFLAAANVNGAIILGMGSQSQSVTSTNVEGFVAKATAPANFTDGAVQAQAGMTVPVGGGFAWALKQETAIMLPAGLGLYYISSLSMVASSAARYCRYILL